jgi:MOSC domain-containing protein YiiM
LREGEVGAGDAIELIGRDELQVAVADITRLYLRDEEDVEKMRRAMQVPALPEGWRNYFAQQIEQPEQ